MSVKSSTLVLLENELFNNHFSLIFLQLIYLAICVTWFNEFIFTKKLKKCLTDVNAIESCTLSL